MPEKFVRRGEVLPCSLSDCHIDRDLQRVCHCSRTVLEPPIPCGTKIFCSYPCNRPAPPCGHRKHPHPCHEDPRPCPPCSFLTSKPCACGKKAVENVTCSREKVFCGTPCGKLVSPFQVHWYSFLRCFPDPSSVASIGARECVILMTVDRVRILVESHGSCGESTFAFPTDRLLITLLQPSCDSSLHGSMPCPRLLPGDRTLHCDGNNHLFMRTNTPVRPMWPQTLESDWRWRQQDPYMYQRVCDCEEERAASGSFGDLVRQD